MIKKIIFLSFIIILQLFAQPHNFRREGEKNAKETSFYFSEVHSIPEDSSNHTYFVYKISYPSLVFVKSSGKYSASFSLSIEVFDSVLKHVVRQIQNKTISVDTFDQTLDHNYYVQGFVNFHLKNGIYNILPFLTDLNINNEIKLAPIRIDIPSSIQSTLISPLIVKSDLIECQNKKYFELANYDDSFPFSEDNFSLVLPCLDTTRESIFVTIKNDSDTVFNSEVSNYFKSKIVLRECKDNILLGNGLTPEATNNFVIPDINRKLLEGNAEIIVSRNKNSIPLKSYNKKIIWFNKPYSLRNPGNAIKMLKFIEKDSVISNMLKANSNDYKKELYNYWKKYNINSHGTFNPLMEEYYSRIDYAAKTFAIFSDKSGIETDRGEIYIQFGKPQKIERASTQYGKVVETWIYEKPPRDFIFVDNDGTGNFMLRK